MNPIITLTTDFGMRDSYVAAMKAAILSIHPSCTIVDVTHHIRPQDITHGAYVVASVSPYFPDGTIHVAVIDPGVGTERRALAIQTGRTLYVGPDNGVLSLALESNSESRPDNYEPFTVEPAPLPLHCRAVELNNPRFHLANVSSTFHGRDIFAPVSAHLANGVRLTDLGQPVNTHHRLCVPTPIPNGIDGVTGAVIYIDTYGNGITNIRPEHVPNGTVTVAVGGITITAISDSYDSAREPVAVWGSNGTLEVALPNGNAAETLGLRQGDTVSMRIGKP